MSTPTRERGGSRRSVGAERARAAGRSRRSEQGSVAEIVRSLLREERESGEHRAVRGPRVLAPAGGLVRTRRSPGTSAPARRLPVLAAAAE